MEAQSNLIGQVDPGTCEGSTHKTAEHFALLAFAKCSICMEGYKKGDMVCWSQNLSCSHVFHTECLIPWLMHHNICPNCRSIYARKGLEYSPFSFSYSILKLKHISIATCLERPSLFGIGSEKKIEIDQNLGHLSSGRFWLKHGSLLPRTPC